MKITHTKKRNIFLSFVLFVWNNFPSPSLSSPWKCVIFPLWKIFFFSFLAFPPIKQTHTGEKEWKRRKMKFSVFFIVIFKTSHDWLKRIKSFHQSNWNGVFFSILYPRARPYIIVFNPFFVLSRAVFFFLHVRLERQKCKKVGINFWECILYARRSTLIYIKQIHRI